MTQPQTLDRLSSVDAGFVHAEDGGDAHMHIGGIAVLAGPPPAAADFAAHIAGRLQLTPRFRQKLVAAPLRSGRPLWVDDPSFRISYHVRQTALPRPGSEEQLLVLAARILSQRLDRSKPLWEVWLVEGLEGSRFAIISKTHHAMVDGVGGVDLLTATFDLSREPRELPADDWTPAPLPSRLGLLARGAAGAMRNARELGERGLGMALSPRQAVGEVTHAAQALGEVARTFLDPAPSTPLNQKPGPHRRVALVRTRLQDYRTVKDALGGTVNDVILAAVAGGLGRFLAGRGVATDGLTLRACVPVSIRQESQRGGLGNQITIMVAPLAVGVSDPVERLSVVREAMDGLKKSKQAEGARLLTQMEQFMPPTVLAQAARLSFSSRLYNLLVTNVPGPQFPVYLLGRELTELFPLAFLAVEHTVAIGIISYNGAVNFGLIGDYDAVPDLDLLAKEVEAALAELVAAAGG